MENLRPHGILRTGEMQRDHRPFAALVLTLILALVAGLTAVVPLLFRNSTTLAQDTGWQNPASENATSAGTGGDGFEVNPTYAYADDNYSAENQGGLGDSHLYYNYGFNIPSGATINGIGVRLDWFLDSDNGTNSMSAELSWDGGISWTPSSTDNAASTTEHSAYLGGSTDSWGRSWSPLDFTNDNFRVRITCSSDVSGRIFYLDWVPVIVYYAPVHHLELAGNGAMAAGGSDVLTITARDTDGNVAVNYSGAKSLVFSGPGQAPGGQNPTVGGANIGSSTSVTFTNGVSDNATATTLLAYKSETVTLHVNDGTIDSYTSGSHGLGLTVSAASAANLDLTPDGGNTTAGSSFSVTVTAYDNYTNIAAGYLGTIHFTSSDPNATMPSDYTFVPSDNGTYAFTSGVTLRTSGSQSVTVTDNANGSLTNTESWSVSAAAIDHYHVTSVSYSQTAGSPFTITITAHDQFHNVVNDSSTSVTMTSSSGTMAFDANGDGTYGDNSKTLTNGTFDITARDNTAATGVTVTATDAGSKTGTSSAYTISSGAIDHYTVVSDNYTQQVTVPFTISVTAYDAFGNLVAADNVTVTISSSLLDMLFDGNGNGKFGEAGDNIGTLAAGTFDIQAKAKTASDNVTITAADGSSNTGTSASYTIEDFRCFIATAAYGTPMIDRIQVLRDFRDQYLMKNPAGRWFVSIYYKYSPPLARFIARHDSLRALVRVVLTPVIWLTALFMKTTLLQKAALLITILAVSVWVSLWVQRRRHSSMP